MLLRTTLLMRALVHGETAPSGHVDLVSSTLAAGPPCEGLLGELSPATVSMDSQLDDMKNTNKQYLAASSNH